MNAFVKASIFHCKMTIGTNGLPMLSTIGSLAGIDHARDVCYGSSPISKQLRLDFFRAPTTG